MAIRLCVSYILSGALITFFVYALVSTSIQNTQKLKRLREEVDEIAHVMLHSDSPPGQVAPQDTTQLTEVVDGMLKKKLTNIWDDIYTVKKQLRSAECNLGKRKSCAVGEKMEEAVNYASLDLGAKIHFVDAEPVGGTSLLKSLFSMEYKSNPPVNMIKHFMEPGNCFAFQNSRADVIIKLADEIIIQTVELEHISQALSPTGETSSAPKHFEVYGLNSDGCESEDLLGSFNYDNSPTSRVQLYNIQTDIKRKFIRFKFLTNHGHPNYTCIYRLAVYGKLN